MPGLKLEASLYVFDRATLDDAIQLFLQTEMRRAIRAFLKACLARIPVRTGFLKGSFGNINRFFGNGPIPDLNPVISALFQHRDYEREAATQGHLPARVRELQIKNNRFRPSVGSGRRGNPRQASPIRKEYYYPPEGGKVLKTPYSGLPYATPAEQVLTFKGATAVFALDIDISYYRVNDFTSRIRGAPWASLEAGQDALLASLAGAADRFPALAELAGIARIAVDGTRKTETYLPPQKILVSNLNG